MRDPEILAHFDGRGRAEFVLGGFEGRHTARITAIGHELGYALKSTEIRGRSVARLVYVRDDSPLARRRAGQTLDRLRTGGALLPPGGVEMATRRQQLDAHEEWGNGGIRSLVVLFTLLGLGSLLVAWALRDDPGAAAGVVLGLGVPCAVAAFVIPRRMRRWYERNRQLVRRYDQERGGRVGPPPPPPSLG